MYGKDISKYMSRCERLQWTITSSDRLRVLRRPCAIICNTDESHMPGKHWIVMYLSERGDGECFDSYGRHPGLYHANFTRFMNRHCRSWVYNDRVLQGPFTQTCGHYCVVYAACKCNGYSLEEVVDAMEKAGEKKVVASVKNY